LSAVLKYSRDYLVILPSPTSLHLLPLTMAKERGGGGAGRHVGEGATGHGRGERGTGARRGGGGGERGERGAVHMEKRRNYKDNNGGGSPEKTKFDGTEKKIIYWR
jgi:hypothetical protein